MECISNFLVKWATYIHFLVCITLHIHKWLSVQELLGLNNVHHINNYDCILMNVKWANVNETSPGDCSS